MKATPRDCRRSFRISLWHWEGVLTSTNAVPEISNLRTKLASVSLARRPYLYGCKCRQIGQSVLYERRKLGWFAACDLEWWQSVRLCHKVRPWPLNCRPQVTLDRPPAPRLSFLFLLRRRINCRCRYFVSTAVESDRFCPKWFSVARSVLKDCVYGYSGSVMRNLKNGR